MLAYIGPGGGIAITVSIFTILLGIFAVVFAYIAWPLTFLLSLLRSKCVRFRYPFRKVVVLGLDGLDPKLVRRFMDEGKLPHFRRLAETGHFSELTTTLPAMTPAAWPSFMTGNDPSYHGIYDFITPDRRTYLPKLSSYETIPPRGTLALGRLRLPLGAATTRNLRKGIPFWETLAQHGVECTILRVPITFPPPRFRGRLLSGLCVPDLLGSQGTFTCYTSAPCTGECDGGQMQPLHFNNHVARAHILGPPNPWCQSGTPLKTSFTIRHGKGNGQLHITVGSERLVLSVGEQGRWIPVCFRAGFGAVRGQVQFQLIRTDPHIVLYMSPVQIVPERAAMSVSHPRLYADYLAKSLGSFGTLGFLEDTSALNEGVFDEEAFLQQAYGAFQERCKMFFHALDLKADDVTVCVFDTPDRVQHMFWRYLEEDHPVHQHVAPVTKHADAIERLYIEMDHLVGQTLEQLRSDALLAVISDHGFTTFQRQVDLNAWLHQHGYLYIKDNVEPDTPWLEAVDWSRTRAYALGLSGLFINLKGREGQGIVQPGSDYDDLVRELKDRLEQLTDPDRPDEMGRPQSVIQRVYISRAHFRGPYRDQAPDLLIGYESGYRVAWNCAKGQVGSQMIFDNTKAWSGDHCVDPTLVPGVLLTNQPLPTSQPRLIDLPATILDIFGITSDAPMQGRSLFRPSDARLPTRSDDESSSHPVSATIND